MNATTTTTTTTAVEQQQQQNHLVAVAVYVFEQVGVYFMNYTCKVHVVESYREDNKCGKLCLCMVYCYNTVYVGSYLYVYRECYRHENLIFKRLHRV